MSLKDFTIPMLHHGVSQEPVTTRSPYHLEEQINGVSSVNSGLSKRYGSSRVTSYQLARPESEDPTYITENYVNLPNTSFFKTLEGIHYSGEKFIYQILINVHHGHLWVKHLSGPDEGVLYHVMTSEYLKGNRRDLKVIVDGSKVYLLNRGKVVIGSNSQDFSYDKQGSLIHVVQSTANIDYIVDVELFNSDKTASYGNFSTTATIGTDVAHQKTSYITEQILTGLRNARNTLTSSDPDSPLNIINLESSVYKTGESYLNIRLDDRTASQWELSSMNDDATLRILASGDTTKDNTVVVSVDSGVTWSEVSPYVTKESWSYLKYCTNGYFYLGSNSGVIIASNDLDTWSVVSSDTSMRAVLRLEESNGRLFILYQGNRVLNNNDFRTQISLYYINLSTNVINNVILTNMNLSSYHQTILEDISINSINGDLILLYWYSEYTSVPMGGYLTDQVNNGLKVCNLSISLTPNTFRKIIQPQIFGPFIWDLRNSNGFNNRLKSIQSSRSSMGFNLIATNTSNIIYSATTGNTVNLSIFNVNQPVKNLIEQDYIVTMDGKLLYFDKTDIRYYTLIDIGSEEIKSININEIEDLSLITTNSYTYYLNPISNLYNKRFWDEFRVSPILNSFDYKLVITSKTTKGQGYIYTFNGYTKDITALPQGPDGFNILVESNSEEGLDNYYVQYDSERGYWKEAVKKGLTSSIEDSTLPIKFDDISLNPNTVPEFASRLTIKERTSGDEFSNPLPTFVGKKINDIFLMNNRFGILSGSNVILSKLDDYQTFFRTANSQILVTDRIDLKASLPSSRGTDLKFAMPFDNELLLSSNTSQYALRTNNAFDPKSSSLEPLTEYHININCDPINTGNSIYLTIDRSVYGGVLDFHRISDRNIRAEDITKHIPRYIKGTIMEMVASTTENVVVARTNDNYRKVYIQNKSYENDQQVQNAWHSWEFDEVILGMDIVGNTLYITSTTDTGIDPLWDGRDVNVSTIYLGSTIVNEANDRNTLTFGPRLDMATRVLRGGQLSTDIYNSPYYYVNPNNVDRIVGVDNKGRIFRGRNKINEILLDNNYWIKNFPNFNDQHLWVGLEFEHSFTFSQQVVANYSQGEKNIFLHSKLLLRNIMLAFENTGKFDVKIKSKGREETTQKFSGMVLGDESAQLGRINISTGIHKFSINSMADAVTIKVVSNNPFPTSFNTAEWQGEVIQRSGRF